YDHERKRAAYFYGKFYFISRIEDKLELRSFINDDGTLTYKSVANLHREVKNKRIVKKIERSFTQLLNQIIESQFVNPIISFQKNDQYDVAPLGKDLDSIQRFLDFFSFPSKMKLLDDLRKINNNSRAFYNENIDFFKERGIEECYE